jgi:hypothetical protein
MAQLEDLTRGASVRGILPDRLVTVADVKWFGTSSVELTYRDPKGRLGIGLLFQDREDSIEIAKTGRPRSFDGDGKKFRLVAEAHRIRLAHLFDLVLAHPGFNDCDRRGQVLGRDKSCVCRVPPSGKANFVGERSSTPHHHGARRRTTGARMRATCYTRSSSLP